MEVMNFTVVVAVNNLAVLASNLFSSPDIKIQKNHQLVIKSDFSSAALAYNPAIEEAKNEIIIFIHQDIYLPEGWFENLSNVIQKLDDEKVNWGVLGCFGSAKGRPGGVGRLYTTGLGMHGNSIKKPEIVETLDEIVLIIRKSSGLSFDPLLPHFHLYGTDICMAARERGLLSLAFPNFCIHNTNQIVNLPKEFFKCYRHIKKRWRKYLPIYTSCIKISKFDSDVHLFRIKKIYHKLLGKSRSAEQRIDDPIRLYSKIKIAEES